MIGRENWGKGWGRITQALGAESVDTREYHGKAGDRIQIDPFMPGVEKVLVAIQSDRTGLVERGVAQLDPASKSWIYTATVDLADADDWSLTVTAVGRFDARPMRRTGRRLRKFS